MTPIDWLGFNQALQAIVTAGVLLGLLAVCLVVGFWALWGWIMSRARA